MSESHSPPLPALNRTPPEIHCARDYELLARRFIAAPGYEYIAGGSGQEATLAANLAAFSGWTVCPRLLCDVGDGNTRLSLLGRELPSPILLAPVAYHKLAHPVGELETARGAAIMRSCMVVSTLSSYRLEEIAAVAGEEKWFQLYFQPRRDVTLDLLRRAEAAGYRTIVLTLDAAIQVAGQRALRAGFRMPEDCISANLQDYPQPEQISLHTEQSRIFQGLMRDAPTWADLDWLLTQTSLPVWVKGVLHAADARKLQSRGVAGLVVSNHGGRSLDGAPASLSALPAIRDAVGTDYPLILDSGIRSGTDIFKGLALGADAVMIGRLQLYALSVAGALGVAHVIKLLREELEVCMALTGCASLADIRRAVVEPVRPGRT